MVHLDSEFILSLWKKAHRLPRGNNLFSRLLGFLIPYSGTIRATILHLEPGVARIAMEDRRKLRNHLNSIHAIALANLGELATGLAVVTALSSKGRAILVGFSIKYTKKARGMITAQATCALLNDVADQDVEVSGELRDQKGDVIAQVSACWRIGKKL